MAQATHWPDYAAGLPGTSLIRIAEGDMTGRCVLSEYHDGWSPTAIFMLRWDKWKYVHYVGYEPELYNLADDPREMTNLADSASHRECVRRSYWTTRCTASR